MDIKQLKEGLKQKGFDNPISLIWGMWKDLSGMRSELFDMRRGFLSYEKGTVRNA